MSTTTALPQELQQRPQQRAPLQRTTTVETQASSNETTPADSPSDSPRNSPSSTSLSSLSSIDAQESPKKLIDSYGNEFQIPDYTIKDIRDAIPAHCFERSAATGLYYVARDITLLSITFYIFHNYVTPANIPSTPVRAGLWALYTFLQGLFATGLWVLAHECGHQSFSTSKTLNDTVGWILHSSLLVPYFSWKISHGKHHKATGHMQRDMVFVPSTRDHYANKLGKFVHELSELTEDTPITTLIHLVVQQLGGWPAYLLSNVTGHNFHEKQVEGKGKGKVNGYTTGVNHFNPGSPLYERKDEKLILLSDLGIALVFAALYYLGHNFGWANLAVWYFIPYLWVNHWLVAITFLQHTDPSLPHYQPEQWTFTRGAAATIDRDFWPIGPHLLHGIIETHVLHHYISTIPFYHADEATEAIKGVMGKHYRSDTAGGWRGFLAAIWRSGRWCQWVEEGEENSGVLFFRNRNGLGVPPKKMAPAS